MADDIPEVVGELTASAITLHELYRSYVEAGFTEAQAFDLARDFNRLALVAHIGGHDAG